MTDDGRADRSTDEKPGDPEPTADDSVPVTGDDAGSPTTDVSVSVDDEDPVPLAEEAVGDGRRKYVEVVTREGDRHEHGDSYLRETEDVFLVSPEPGFPETVTVTYHKNDLDRVSVEQHHSSCFITTAVAGEEETLSALRGFRDDSLSPSPAGRPLVTLYEAISPPIADTLAARPDGTTARAVRSLVRACATLARRRERESGVTSAVIGGLLVGLYGVGIAIGSVGHLLAAVDVVESDGE